jgi:hypothetical protein
LFGIALVLGAVEPAAAHVPQLRGRLVDLVAASDLVIVGTVEQVTALEARATSTTVRVDATLVGEAPTPTVTFRSQPRFAAGGRFVFFLRRAGAGFECVQPAGTVFRSSVADDDRYRAVVTGIRLARRGSPETQPAALRAALVPALSAAAPALRYHAVLELAALAHHGLSPSERQSLQRLAADPATDTAIRSIVRGILDQSNSPLERGAPSPPAGPGTPKAAGLVN